MTYQPQQRTTRVRILTPLGWLDGEIRPPERAALVDYLTHAPPFIIMSDVHVESTSAHLPHFSLQHDAMRLVVPEVAEENLERDVVEGRPHRILVALDQGSVEGTVVALRDARVSDHFTHRKGFFLVTDATLRLVGAKGALVVEVPRLLVNADHILGAADLDVSAAP